MKIVIVSDIHANWAALQAPHKDTIEQFPLMPISADDQDALITVLCRITTD